MEDCEVLPVATSKRTKHNTWGLGQVLTFLALEWRCLHIHKLMRAAHVVTWLALFRPSHWVSQFVVLDK